MLNRAQSWLIAAGIVLILLIYFGLDTKSKDHKQIEKSRTLSAQSADGTALEMEAKKTLAQKDLDHLHTLADKLEISNDSSAKAEILKQIAGKWFDIGNIAVSGHYAEEIAKLLKDEESWSMAGTTYTIGIRRSEDQRIKSFCAERAISCFEQAIAINPSNVSNRINLAICYAEMPPQDNPMKGPLMLLDLNKTYPDNVQLLKTLAKLAIQTGQYEKAIARMEKADSLAPKDEEVPCILADAYTGAGQQDKAALAKVRCKK